MNTEEKNNYVQYVNRHGIVKSRNVVFEDDGTTTRFTVDGIDEEFFIFAIYQNNIQRFCVGIDNLENTDMLGFINANMVDLSSIPPYAFLQSQTVVQFSYNNEYVQNYKFGATPVSTAITQQQHSDNLWSLVARDSGGNEILDPDGWSALNVVVLKNPELSNVLSHPDAIFLDEFCKIAFPANPYVIRPFVHNLSSGKPLEDLNGKMLFYAQIGKPAVLNYVFSLLNKGVGNVVDCFANTYFIPEYNEKILFNRTEISNGSNFLGITEVTDTTKLSMISGFVAIFTNPISVG